MQETLKRLAFLCGLLLSLQSSSFSQVTFSVSLDPGLRTEPYTGRIYVALSDQTEREPRLGMSSWFNPPPLYSLDVVDLQPGQALKLDAKALFHPTPLNELAPGTWFAQAVARCSLDSPNPGLGEGDLCSAAVEFHNESGSTSMVELLISETVHEPAFQETDRVKLFEHESQLLSEFNGRPCLMRGAVVLPDGWDSDASGSYPIIYSIPGFGGRHTEAYRLAAQLEASPADSPMRRVLHVVLDPSCYRGHSVFADSATNGPWGTALVEEFIPQLEQRFHGPRDARFRFVTGGSSGGWASLWLQVVYPDSFGSCYSHVPDPVDFRDFQRINLLRRGENMFVDPEGERRPLARRGEQYLLWYDDFVARETVLGPGGQIHSFEAVFSQRRSDGTPAPVFDRETGAVDLDVAKSWSPYDIRKRIQENWESMGPKWEGKIHIYAGEVDTFFLEGAVLLLQKALASLGSDVVCEVVPGMAHATFPGGVDAMYTALLAAWDQDQAAH